MDIIYMVQFRGEQERAFGWNFQVIREQGNIIPRNRRHGHITQWHAQRSIHTAIVFIHIRQCINANIIILYSTWLDGTVSYSSTTRLRWRREQRDPTAHTPMPPGEGGQYLAHNTQTRNPRRSIN